MRNSRGFPSDALIGQHLTVIRPIALDLKRRLPAKIQLTDLESAGRAALVAALRSFDPSGAIPIAAWVRVKVRGGMLDAVRGLAYREALHKSLPDGFRDGGRDPEQRAADEQGAARVRKALDQLTVAQRQVLQLRYAENLSERETAARANVSIAAVKRRRSRAIKGLKEALGEYPLSARAVAIALA